MSMATQLRLVILAGAALLAAVPGHALAPQDATPAPAAPLLVPFTDHYQMTIAKPANIVWAHIKRLYVDGERARQQGYTVTPLTDDPTAYLGGTMARKPSEPNRPFVKIRVGAIDEQAMLLTLVIDLENPTPVYATHQVRPDGANGSIYQTIVQTMMPVAAKPGEVLTAAMVADRMRPLVQGHQKEVAAILQREKVVIEALP